MIKTLSTLGSLALLAGLAQADVIDVFADSYTHNADTNNYGSEPVVRCKWDWNSNDHMRITYLKFDLSAYTGQTLSSAALELTTTTTSEPVSGDSTTGTWTYRMWGLDPALGSNAWDELTLTGANRPAPYSYNDGTDSGTYEYVDEAQTWGGTALLTWSNQPPDTTMEIGGGDANLLGFLNAAKELNAGMVTLILHKDDHASNDWGSFRSKEGSATDYPKLVLGIGPGTPYCPGDGIAPHTACPFGNDNDGSMGGCDWANPSFPGGGYLTASGSDSISASNTYLHATGVENNFGIFFEADNQVNGGNGNPLNDGLRCAGGALVRLTPPTAAANNAATTPAPIQTLGSTAVAGVAKRYQYWFRTPTGPGGQMANLTNGYEILWTP